MIQQCRNKRPYSIFDIGALSLCITSAVSLIMLAAGSFSATLSIVISLIILSAIIILLRRKIRCRLSWRTYIPLILILLFSFFLRFSPFLYVAGGQDEGLYVNMSRAYERHGSTIYQDDFREELPQELKELYDETNHRDVRVRVKGEYEGIHLLGIYIKSLDTSSYVFQFYPLHPLWMSLFGKFIGSQNRVYSLVFFALISLLATYGLTYEISNSRFAALIAVGLLSVNPLHVFFSRFPVTEVMAFAFNVSALYYLIRYYKEEQKGNHYPLYLFLATGLFGCFCFTRVTGFLYLPFFLLILFLVIIYKRYSKIELKIGFAIVIILILYTISVLYGLKYSYPYSHDIYLKTFGRLAHDWVKWLAMAGLFIVALVFLLVFSKIIRLAVRRFMANNTRWLLPAAIGCIILSGAYLTYRVVFTDAYIDSGWLGKRWSIAGQGWRSVARMPLTAMIVYLSPPLFGAFIAGLAVYKHRRWTALLLVFVILFWAINIVLKNGSVPYHYYYARYLLSETLPYTIFLVAIYLAALWQYSRTGKILTAVLVGVSTAYFLLLTIPQLSMESGNLVYEPLKRVSRRMDRNDVIVLKRPGFPNYSEARTALEVYFGVPVFAVEQMDRTLFEKLSDHISGEIYLLSPDPVSSPSFEQIEEIPYRFGSISRAGAPPFSHHELHVQFHLYELNKQVLKKTGLNIQTGTLVRLGDPSLKLEGFHADGVWTTEHAVINNVNINITGELRYLVVRTKGYRPDRVGWREWGLIIKIDNYTLQPCFWKDNDLYLELPKDFHQKGERIGRIEIYIDTFVPVETSRTGDKRDLGLDIDSFRLE